MLHKRSLRFRNVYSSDFGLNTLFLRCLHWSVPVDCNRGRLFKMSRNQRGFETPNQKPNLKVSTFVVRRQTSGKNVSGFGGVGGDNEPSSVRSYLFFHSALGFAQPTSAAPTPVRLAPTGPVQAPSPPRLMGGPPHPPRKATTQRCHCQQRRPALK